MNHLRHQISYIIAFDASRCELQPNVTDFRIEDIVAMVVQSRVEFDWWIIGSCVRCDVDEIRYFRFRCHAKLEIPNVHVRRDLNTIFNRENGGILVTVSIVE